MYDEETGTFKRDNLHLDHGRPAAALLVAHAPADAVRRDRFSFEHGVQVGRSDRCEISIEDGNLSRAHFRITAAKDGYVIADMGSKNGTHVNGRPIEGREKLPDHAVIRAGRVLMVFCEDAADLVNGVAAENHGIVGSFQTALLVISLSAWTVTAVILSFSLRDFKNDWENMRKLLRERNQ